MPYRPYPNADRALRQLDRHDDETGPCRAPRPMTPFERQLTLSMQGVRDSLRLTLTSVGDSLRAARWLRPVGSEETSA